MEQSEYIKEEAWCPVCGVRDNKIRIGKHRCNPTKLGHIARGVKSHENRIEREIDNGELTEIGILEDDYSEESEP